jgi:hypothetical protein
MKNKKYCFLVVIIFSILVSISCRTTGLSRTPIDINGMVYDFTNRPVAHCRITLGRRHAGITDINGRFVLPRVPPGTYTITVYKDGHETFSDEILIQDQGQIIYIRIPSQSQLLNLADEALTAMNIVAAEEFVQRAYQIDKNNIEMLFYYATIKFRQQKYREAIEFLMAARNLGSRDPYIGRFLTILGELTDEEDKN